MKVTTLPNPGRIVNSLLLRREVVKAISGIEVSRRPNGKHPAADDLARFLDAASAYVKTFSASVLEAVNTVAPALTGTAKVGQTLTVTNGTWTGTGITYTRKWFVGGEPINNAGTTYVVKAADVGKTIKVDVTATNDAGAIVKSSNASVAVIP